MSAESAVVVIVLLFALGLVAGAVVELGRLAYRRWQDRDGDWRSESNARPRW